NASSLKDYLTKFDPKSYEGVFLGYSQNSKAYIILNKQTIKVKESLNVTFDETPPPSKTSPLEDDDLVEEEAIKVNETRPLGNDDEDKFLENNEIINIKESKSHPLENVIDSKAMKTLMSAETKLTKDKEGESVDNTKYREDLKTSHLETVKRIFRYIKGTTHLRLWYPKGSGIETVEQTALAISTTEAEYVSAGKACQQALWMKQALVDYGICLDDIPIMCDNKGVIDLSKNPVQHSRTKNIKIRHHFLRDNFEKGNISIEKVPSEDNIADILTKPLKREPFNYLRLGLGMMKQND
ncbi:hypothetical protein Tco_1097699, partial [Tanacetum coccineum]